MASWIWTFFVLLALGRSPRNSRDSHGRPQFLIGIHLENMCVFLVGCFHHGLFFTCKTARIFFLSTSETQVILERAFTPRMSPEILRHPYWVAERVYTCRNIHQTCCVPNFPGLEWTWIHPNVEKVRLVWSVFSI